MTDKLRIDKDNTAVLIMDYQNDILANVADQREALIQNAKTFLTRMRAQKIKIIYICVAFRKGYPEIVKTNKMFGAISQNNKLILGTHGAAIHEMVAAQQDDAIVIKHRVNAFYHTDLQVLLRAAEINKLILLGVSTGGVVLSTLRYAADNDFECIVVKDLCADPDPDVHHVLTGKVFPRQASVVTSADIIF